MLEQFSGHMLSVQLVQADKGFNLDFCLQCTIQKVNNAEEVRNITHNIMKPVHSIHCVGLSNNVISHFQQAVKRPGQNVRSGGKSLKSYWED